MMEERLLQFVLWVNDQQETFYLEILQQEDPMEYFKENIFTFFGKLVTEGQHVLDEASFHLDRTERTQLARKLQRLSEGTLEKINRRLEQHGK